jgi:hypothetical protein
MHAVLRVTRPIQPIRSRARRVVLSPRSWSKARCCTILRCSSLRTAIQRMRLPGKLASRVDPAEVSRPVFRREETKPPHERAMRQRLENGGFSLSSYVRLLVLHGRHAHSSWFLSRSIVATVVISPPITLIFRLLTDTPDATGTESSRNLNEMARLQHS